jgi:NTP pyrophosphatase (non-canonical NTP hydrolase)
MTLCAYIQSPKIIPVWNTLELALLKGGNKFYPHEFGTGTGGKHLVDLRQKELYAWQTRNFGKHEDDDLRCTVGMSEELGELAHFILKSKQKIREGARSNCEADIADAFGDVVIYGLNLLSTRGIDADAALKETIEKVLQRDWVKNPTGQAVK